MFETLETGAGLDIVLALQSMRSGLLDALAILLDAMGSPVFFLLILLLVYWSVDRKLGTRLIFALLVVGIANTAMKDLLARPRPAAVSNQVVALTDPYGYGIPSGHVMIALVVAGYVAVYLHRRWGFWVVAAYVVLMAWARMYAGVHYPQDVVAAIIFGLITLWLFVRFAEPVAARWIGMNPALKVGIIMLAGVITALLLASDPTGSALAGLMIGLGPALELEKRYVNFGTQGSRRQRAARYLAGTVLALILFVGLRVLFGSLAEEGEFLFDLLRVVRYTLVALFAGFIWPLLALRLDILSVQVPESDHV